MIPGSHWVSLSDQQHGQLTIVTERMSVGHNENGASGSPDGRGKDIPSGHSAKCSMLSSGRVVIVLSTYCSVHVEGTDESGHKSFDWAPN